ncbi:MULTISPECIES: hypothetical protein [Maritimibacter]|uniref:hypothetical protein n=1 Tax=Maritimibacter TaxID=404235 RepID=UPI0003211134|nr:MULTISPECIES: hypothetical protein [Maritimibacter]MBL6429255.1 hypothetical protein [Maritimibacter sp.]
MDFIVENGSSNPSSVQLKVPYDTVRILLELTISDSLSPPIQQGMVYHALSREIAQNRDNRGIFSGPKCG